MNYDSNPQTEYLLSKIEEQEKTIKHWVGECAILQQKLDMANEKIGELQEDMEFFNSLPWYERMFHKFDV